MRHIVKGPPPPCVAELRRTEGATWASVRGAQKSEMRRAAVAEQRGVCAYCNRRIDLTSETRMEHWRPRARPDTDPFEWSDLLAVCPGLPNDETCDRRRGDRPLTLHPAGTDPHPERLVRLLADGWIRAEEAVRPDVEEVLGLNHPLLVAARRQAVVAALAVAADPDRLKRALAVLDDPEAPLPPFPTLVAPILRRAGARRTSRAKRLRKVRR